MAHFVYIIYSPGLNKFYIGETEDVKLRLDLHNTGYFKGSFTSKANDWEIFIVINCIDRSHARDVELHIKRMKSKKYLHNLKQYPELLKKLSDSYQMEIPFRPQSR